MTAEFATVVPAVVLVLAVCLGGIQLATRQLQIQDAAALAARSVSRGSDAAQVVNSLISGATARTNFRGNLACVTVGATSTPLALLFGAGSLSATSCALAGGR